MMLVDAARMAGALLAIASGLVVSASSVVAQGIDRVAHIGLLCLSRCDTPAFDALRGGLRSSGWIEGRNLKIEFRAADGHIDRLPDLAQELVNLKPELIMAFNPQATRAAKDATATIPIVFLAVADPVGIGLVDSLARPGGNVTGLATLVPGGLMGKGLELLAQMVPKASRIAVLLNPSNEVSNRLFSLDAQPAARQLGLELHVFRVRAPEDIGPAIDAASQAKVHALWAPGDPIFHNPVQRIPELAARAGLPAMYLTREFVQAGGLMSYGPDLLDLNRRAASYVDKILRGAKPSDLPVEQPTRFHLVINLKTARALKIQVPQSLLVRADEVIE
ncbi:ABC transporter substrate-binding protein [Variovorax robiniae]|uniref:ABC transporter substrate-binding protein n=1 Tax=Variovorax robiniae TaxID=1836199 RepID=A0ABU8XHR0_9BURK